MSTMKLTGDEYMELLEQRRTEWEAEHRVTAEAQIAEIKRKYPNANPRLKPGWEPPVALLEWFVRPGDEALVDLPEPVPDRVTKRVPEPRTYRSAASLIEERDGLAARRDAIARRGDCGDVAAINIAPSSSKRHVATAGRRRFAQMDRDLERYTALSRRIDALGPRIARAEAREAKQTTKES